MADTSLDHKTINFIKKNEGYSETSYMDAGSASICWGNKYLEDGSRTIHISKFDKKRCEKIVYTHYFKSVKPYLPKGLSIRKHIVYGDLVWQYGQSVLKKKNINKYVRSYPERKRWQMLNNI